MAGPNRGRPYDAVGDQTGGNPANADPRASSAGMSASSASGPGTGGSGMGGSSMGGSSAAGSGAAGPAASGGYASAPDPAMETGPAPAGGLGMVVSAETAIALLAGLWLIVSRFVFDYPANGSTAGGVLNGVVIGIAVAVIAVARMSTTARSSPMLGLVTAVLGAWMIASPWVFGYNNWGTGSRPIYSDVIVGVVLFFVGLLSSMGAMRAMRASMGGGGRHLATR